MLTLFRTPSLICLLLGASLVAACGGALSTPTVVVPEGAAPTTISTPSAPGTADIPTPKVIGPGTATIAPSEATGPPTPSATPEGIWYKRFDELTTLSWRLVELDGAAIPADPPIVLELGRIVNSQRQIFGVAGCWEYSVMVDLLSPVLGPVEWAEDQRLSLFPRGCADPDDPPVLVDDYFAALWAGDVYLATDERLETVDGEGATRLVYEPLQPAQRPVTLTGTTWMLRSLRGDEPLPGVGMELQLNPDGVTGSDGCNYYSAGATVSGDGALRVRDPGFTQTAMACADDIMTQAYAYLAALREADGYRLEGDRLEILDRAGEIRLVFEEPGVADLAGVTWTLESIERPVDSAIVLEGTEVTLTVDDATGRLTGSGGCNGYGGTVMIDGSVIAVDDLVRELKLCLDPPGIMEQESALLDVLDHVTTWELDGTALRLTTTDHRALLLRSRER